MGPLSEAVVLCFVIGMPKVRTASTQDVEFKVSPWQTKKKKKGGEVSVKSTSEASASLVATEVFRQVSPPSTLYQAAISH